MRCFLLVLLVLLCSLLSCGTSNLSPDWVVVQLNAEGLAVRCWDLPAANVYAHEAGYVGWDSYSAGPEGAFEVALRAPAVVVRINSDVARAAAFAAAGVTEETCRQLQAGQYHLETLP